MNEISKKVSFGKWEVSPNIQHFSFVISACVNIFRFWWFFVDKKAKFRTFSSPNTNEQSSYVFFLQILHISNVAILILQNTFQLCSDLFLSITAAVFNYNCFVCLSMCVVCVCLFLMWFRTISKNWGFPVNSAPWTRTQTQCDWCLCIHDNNRAIRYILAIHNKYYSMTNEL